MMNLKTMNFGGDRTPRCTASYAGYSTPRGLVWFNDVMWKHPITHKLLRTLYLWHCLWRWPRSPAKCPEVDYQNANTVCPQRKRLKKHTSSCLIVMFMSIQKKKTGSRGTRSVLPSFSPIPSFNYSHYPVDYPSIYPAQRRAFRQS